MNLIRYLGGLWCRFAVLLMCADSCTSAKAPVILAAAWPKIIIGFCGVCGLVLMIVVFETRADDPTAYSGISSTTRIKNPFYQVPAWKLWRTDESPVVIGPISLSPPPARSRRYPIEIDTLSANASFLAFRGNDWSGRIYAGMWDDVYVSLDNHHSYIPHLWRDGSGNEVQLHDQHMHLDYRYSRDPRLLQALGVNFTSQSTIGMGHDLTDSYRDIDILERKFCFANILRAGPAHTSYGDSHQDHIESKYDAIMPCLFNSVGSSGSEVNALAKMLIAGAHLPIKTKLKLKRNGLYIPTLLYLWKASLPYDVPYTNELRHRVAYAASGSSSDQLIQNLAPLNHSYHRYDETAHLRNMVNMAKSMDIAPPIALLTKLEIRGGIEKSINKTTIRVYQKRGEPVRMRISAVDSFDLQDRSLTYSWSVLYGNTPVSIETLDDGREALITVLFDKKLPKGKTVIMLTVNNGHYDSNPAIINVYRPDGANNLRPGLTGFGDRTALSGESIRIDIASTDPEGFPPTLYRWSDEVGTLDGNRFTWKTPDVSSTLHKNVHLIAADGMGSYNSARATLTVTPTLAVIEADRWEGDAPLTVKFSAARSRDKNDNQLLHTWDFDDGQTADSAEVLHTFASPGFYEVSLTVNGPFGPHTDRHIIHVHHSWPRVLDNGWRRGTLNPRVWVPIGSNDDILVHGGGRIFTLYLSGVSKDAESETTGVESVRSFDVPLYLEASFTRVFAQTGSGYEVLGSLIGVLGGTSLSDMSIGQQQADGKWTGSYIGQHLWRVPLSTQLRLYVDHDPNHSGRIQYTGFIESDLGRHFFRLGNQPKRDNRLRILTGRGGQFYTKAFRVWSPTQ